MYCMIRLWKAYYILDEILIAGELQESSKKTVARLIAAQVQYLPECCMYSVLYASANIEDMFVGFTGWAGKRARKLH